LCEYAEIVEKNQRLVLLTLSDVGKILAGNSSNELIRAYFKLNTARLKVALVRLRRNPLRC
jgi:hypothetical protein